VIFVEAYHRVRLDDLSSSARIGGRYRAAKAAYTRSRLPASASVLAGFSYVPPNKGWF